MALRAQKMKLRKLSVAWRQRLALCWKQLQIVLEAAANSVLEAAVDPVLGAGHLQASNPQRQKIGLHTLELAT